MANVSIFFSVSLILDFRMLLRIRSFGKIRAKTPPDFLRWWALCQEKHSAEQRNDGVQQLQQQALWRGVPNFVNCWNFWA